MAETRGNVTRAAMALARRAGLIIVVLVSMGVGFLIHAALTPESVPASPATAPAHDHAAEAPTVYTCSMHPFIRRDKPGKCPICGAMAVRIRTF